MITIEQQIKKAAEEKDFEALKKEFIDGSGFHRQLVLFHLLVFLIQEERSHYHGLQQL